MNIELSELLVNLNIIRSLPDKPSLSSTDLKEKFDEASNYIKNYINETHIQEELKILGDISNTLENLSREFENSKATIEENISTMKSKLDTVEQGANNYIHPSNAGNKHVPSGGSSGQILRWSSEGTAVWGADNNTTYGLATTSANGLMSSTDKTKLNGIATGATKVVVTRGTSTPSGGSDGNIYIQYF